MTGEVEEALSRARKHLRSATLEGLEATSALLDAALRSAGIDDTDPRSFAGELRTSLNDLLAAVRTEGALRFPSALANPVLAALDAEIARWEARSANDAASRPVVRAFLALRELLWELGVRPDEARAGHPAHEDQMGTDGLSARFQQDTAPAEPHPPADLRPPRERVQRFEVE